MYTLQVPNREVLKVISKALELYARMGCEQWDSIQNEFEKVPFHPLLENKSSLSIQNENVPNKSKVAYDVLTIVNHQLASENNLLMKSCEGIPAAYNVWLNKSSKIGSEPMCSITLALSEAEKDRQQIIPGLNLGKGPMIDFCFGGHVVGARINIVTDSTGAKVDVAGMDSKTLVEKLNDGQLFVALGDYLYDNKDSEIEITDFEVNDSHYSERED